MLREFTLTGEWWLPDKPDRRLAGTLRFSPALGAQLELIGRVGDWKPIDRMLERRLMYGRVSGGDEVTLVGCVQGKTSVNTQGVGSLHIHATLILQGALFEDEASLRFDRVSVDYLYLLQWLGMDGFTIDSSKDLRELTLTFKTPESVTIEAEEGLSLVLYVKREGPTYNRPQEEVNLRQLAFVMFDFAEPKTLDEVRGALYHFQNLLTLGTTRPAYPHIIRAWVPKDTEDGPIRLPVEVTFRLVEPPPVTAQQFSFNMLYTYRDVAERFPEIVRSWFAKRESLGPVADLYFGTLHNPRMYLNQFFLNLVQGLESYHRRFVRNQELSEEEHQARMDAILDSCPERHREWLGRRLQFSNEPTLKKRMEELVNIHKRIIVPMVGDTRIFVRKVVDTRHYLTHFDKRLEQVAVSGPELGGLVRTLAIFLESFLLRELGFPEEEIRRIYDERRDLPI